MVQNSPSAAPREFSHHPFHLWTPLIVRKSFLVLSWNWLLLRPLGHDSVVRRSTAMPQFSLSFLFSSDGILSSFLNSHHTVSTLLTPQVILLWVPLSTSEGNLAEDSDAITLHTLPPDLMLAAIPLSQLVVRNWDSSTNSASVRPWTSHWLSLEIHFLNSKNEGAGLLYILWFMLWSRGWSISNADLSYETEQIGNSHRHRTRFLSLY